MRTTVVRWTCSLLFLSALSVSAAPVANITILSQQSGPRQDGMAGAAAAVLNDTGGMVYNPAVLGTCWTHEVRVNAHDAIEDSVREQLVWALPLGKQGMGSGMLAIGFDAYQGGQFQYIQFNESTEEITAERNLSAENDYMLTIGYGRKMMTLFGPWYAGIALKGLYSVLLEEYSAYTVATDIGLLYQPSWKVLDGLSIGISLSNAGLPVKYYEQAEPLPLRLTAGLGYEIRLNKICRMVTAFDFIQLTDHKPQATIGAEAIFWDQLACRAGHFVNHDEDILSVGLGWEFRQFRLDYAYRWMRSLGYRQTFGLSYRFSQNKSLRTEKRKHE